jgi:recombination protein RecA
MPPGNTVGSLSSTQHDILVGSLLGDGTLRKQGTRTNALLEVNHAMQFKEYVDWKWQQFRHYVRTPPKSRNGNGKRIAYRFTTQSLPVFTEYHQWFYRDRKKRVPKDIILTPLALAVWFMDDGTKSRSACYLNTQQFTIEEQQYLQHLLAQTFGIHSTLNRDKHYYRIRITSRATRTLHDVVRPHILPCFCYKLME